MEGNMKTRIRTSEKIGKNARIISTYSMSDWIGINIILFLIKTPFKLGWWFLKMIVKLILLPFKAIKRK